MRMLDGHIHMNNDAAENVANICHAKGYSDYSIMSLGQSAKYGGGLQNLACIYAKLLNPNHAYCFASLEHPIVGETPVDYRKHAERWLAAGCDGIKLLETKPDRAKELGFSMDDTRFDAMFAMLEERQVPIMWHVGDPAPFWDVRRVPSWAVESGWAYIDGSFPALETLYRQVENVLNRHPNLKVAFAHFYFTSDDIEHAERMFASYPNLYYDLTPGVEMYENFSANMEQWRPFILRRQKCLLHGTDTHVLRDSAPNANPDLVLNVWEYFSKQGDVCVMGNQLPAMGLPQDALERIFGGNYRAYAGEQPHAIQPDALRSACQATYQTIEGRGNAQDIALARELLRKIESNL